MQDAAEPGTLRHMICDQSLAAHSGRKAKTLQSFERHLKRTALFYEGVIVPDSDLNNNVRFQAATQNDEPGHTFVAEAIQSGFIVRAARKAPSGGPISQQRAEHVWRPMDGVILELHRQGWRRVSK